MCEGFLIRKVGGVNMWLGMEDVNVWDIGGE